MWLDEEKPILKRDLVFAKPYVNASGTLGFAPDSRDLPILENLGAFITNPISRRARIPAANRAYLPFPGGFLLHSGHPNPGITNAIARNKRRWVAASLPVIVHILVESSAELAQMVRKLEGLENILAIELGLPPACDPAMLITILEAGQGELPVIPCVTPEQVPIIIGVLKDLQPAAVHLVEPRGAMPGQDGGLVAGRLYGPAIFPMMLKAAQGLVAAGLCVIANGGIVDRWQIAALLDAGVTAVGLGSALWRVEQGDIFLS